MDGNFAGYINLSHNLKHSKEMNSKKLSFGKSAFEKLAEHLVNSDRISTTAIEGFIDAFGFYLYNLGFKDMKRDRVSVLIKKKAIEYIPINYYEIKAHHYGLNIVFAEQNKEAFMTDLETYDLDALDFTLLIRSSVFSCE